MRSEKSAPFRRIAGAVDGGEARQRLVPGLTVLYHPDLERVGEWVALPELVQGGEAELSRLVPDFTPPFPDQPGGRRRWPLTDAWLSRRPLRLGAAGGGAVQLALAGSRTRVEADGWPVEGKRIFSAEAVERGVVLLLSGRIVLLLHPVDPLGAEPRPERWPHAGSREDRALDLVGESRPLAQLRRELSAAAEDRRPVLLRGEEGTGRERVARALHRLGRLPVGPFLRATWGAVGPGAADGSDPSGPGVEALEALFRDARGGTLFLDRIEGLPLAAQGWLASRLGREAGLEGTGGSARVRLVAASGVSLEQAVAQGHFRPPLLHLLVARSVRLPPLRACRDDLGRLLVHLLAFEARHTPGHAPPRSWLPAALVARLALHPWPGNQDQLRRVVERLVRVHREAPAAAGQDGPPASLLAAVLEAELGEAGATAGSGTVPVLQRR